MMRLLAMHTLATVIDVDTVIRDVGVAALGGGGGRWRLVAVVGAVTSVVIAAVFLNERGRLVAVGGAVTVVVIVVAVFINERDAKHETRAGESRITGEMVQT